MVEILEFPYILNLMLVEANLEKDPILKTIKDTTGDKNPGAKEVVTRLAQYCNDFSARENCLWMDGRLAIPIDLSTSILNRLQFRCMDPTNAIEKPLSYCKILETQPGSR